MRKLDEDILSKPFMEVVAWNGVFDDENESECIKLVRYKSLHDEEYSEWLDAKRDNNRVAMLDGLIDRFVVNSHIEFLSWGIPEWFKTNGFEKLENLQIIIDAYQYKFDAVFVNAFNEVMRSNWTKFVNPSEHKELNAIDECEWIEKNRKCKGHVNWYSQNGYVFFKDSSGKLMKPRSYSPPNLAQFIKD